MNLGKKNKKTGESRIALTLEQEITKRYKFFKHSNIENLKWRNERPIWGTMYIEWRTKELKTKRVKLNTRYLHRVIEQAPLAECLTSSSEYIREYRRWYENDHANR